MVNITQGGLNFNVNLDTSGFLRGANIIEQSNANLIATLQALNNRIIDNNRRQENSFASLGKSIAGFFAVGQIKSFITEVVNVRGEFQKVNSAFETMLGSKEKADKLMAQAVRLAAITPFDLAGVTTGAKQLLAYGFAAEDVTANLTMLGNIASGVGSTLTDIVYLYGTLKASGRVTQIDINQFANRGIPIYEELAKSMGVANDKVRQLVSSGQVGFPQIEKAFKNMTGAGGRFFELMEKQSKSLSGQVANLEDAWSQMINSIGEQSEGILAGSISAATALVENYDKVLKALGVIISMYGTYKAAIILSTIATSGLTAVETLHYGVLVIVQKAQALLNATILANPYVAAATAIAGLVAALILFTDSTTAAERAQNNYNLKNEEFTDSVERLKNKYSELSAIVRDINQTEYQRQKAYSELQKLFPQTLKDLEKEAFLRLNVADAQKNINNELDSLSLNYLKSSYKETSKEVEVLTDRVSFLNKKIVENRGDRITASAWKNQLKDARELLNVVEKQNNEYKKQIKDIEFSSLSKEKQLLTLKKELETLTQQKETINKFPINPFSQWNLDNINKQIDELYKKIGVLTGTDGQVIRNEAYFESEIKRIKDLRAPLDVHSKEFAAYTKQITALENELSKALGRGSKNESKVAEKLSDQRLSLLENIKNAESEVAAARLGQNEKELNDNRIKYKKMLDDIEEFNKKAKKAGEKLISKDIIDNVKNLSTEEKEAIIYRQNTTKQALEYERQKQLFVEFENYKTIYGEVAAKQRYGNEIKNNAQLLVEVQRDFYEITKQKNAGPLSIVEQERYDQLKKQVHELTDLELKRFASVLETAKSYTQKLEDLENEYQQNIIDLRAATDGKITKAQLSVLRKQFEAKKKSLEEEKAFAESGYAELMASLLLMTKKAAIERLQAIKAGYENNETLTQEQKDGLIKPIDAQIARLHGDGGSFQRVLTNWKKYRELVKAGKKDTLEAKRAYQDFAEEVSNSAQKVNQVLSSISESLSELGIGGEGLQDVIKNISGMVDGIGGIAKGVASGNPIDIITGSIKLLTSAISLFNNKDKKIQKQIDGFRDNLESLEKTYASLDRAVKNSVGESYYTDSAKQIENLKKQQQELFRIRNAEASKKKADNDKLKDLDRQIEDIPNKIADIESAISEQLIQGTFKDLANSLADALMTAFQTGEDGIDAMNQSFNQFIGNAIKNSLKLKLIEPIIAQLTEDLVTYAKKNDNSILGFNFEDYKAQLDKAGKTFTEALEANKEFFVDSSKKSELSRGFQGITENTANRLESEFGGLRLAFMSYEENSKSIHAEIMAMNNRKMSALLAIQENTGVTASNSEQLKRLEAVEKALISIDKKISNSDSLKRGSGI